MAIFDTYDSVAVFESDRTPEIRYEPLTANFIIEFVSKVTVELRIGPMFPVRGTGAKDVLESVTSFENWYVSSAYVALK
jgi:hypothetical protein